MYAICSSASMCLCFKSCKYIQISMQVSSGIEKTMECLVLKIKCITFIVHLQGHLKDPVRLWSIGEIVCGTFYYYYVILNIMRLICITEMYYITFTSLTSRSRL